MLLACLPFGPVVTSNETFWPSLSVLNPGMLIAEKCANRSSPPPSGVMNPNPLASLNHFTVPVAISVIPHEQNRNRDASRPCFDLKERTTVERLQSGRTGRTYCLETKTRRAGYKTNPAGARGIFKAARLPFWGVPPPAEGAGMGRLALIPTGRLRPGRARHPRPAR